MANFLGVSALAGAKMLVEMHELEQTGTFRPSAFVPTLWANDNAVDDLSAVILSAQLLIEVARSLKSIKANGVSLEAARQKIRSVEAEYGID